MRRLLVSIFMFCGLMLIQSIASAGMIRIADVGADKLATQISGVLSQNNVRITEVWRSRDMDIVKEHLYGWRCKYGMKNSSQPDGDITFWADEQGYVFGLRIIYDKPDAGENSSMWIVQRAIFSALTGADVSNADWYRRPEGGANGFYVNNRNKKHYCILMYPRVRTDGSNIVDWGSAIFANTSVSEPVSFPEAALINESYNNGSWQQ